MKRAYVDSSCLVGVALGEGAAARLRKRLLGFDQLFSSNLLEAEVRSALRREGVTGEEDLLSWVDWVIPSRPLSGEMRTVLDTGYLRGADLWHLATALYLAPDPAELSFLTLDERQAAVARALGFPA